MPRATGRYKEWVGRVLRAPLVWVVAALATAAAVLLIGSGEGDDSPQPAEPRVASTPRPARIPQARPEQHPPQPRDHRRVEHEHEHEPDKPRVAVPEAVAQSKPARLDSEQEGVAGVIRGYVAALNAHDGARACALFLPAALSAVDFPQAREDCAASLSASIGYRDPRGFPVYESSRVARIPAVDISGAEARVTATVVTHFEGRREPSVEDDVIYLRETGGRWRIAKPSLMLYRAIGAGNIPPSVLAPP